MDCQKNINIAFFGAVSVGKSTLINTLLGYDLSSCKKKRTTMVPFVYRLDNTNENFSFINDIKQNINKINNDFIEKSEKRILNQEEILTEQIISVPKKNIFNLSEGFVLNIYDIPGLNDARTKNSYYKYLGDNFKKFDMVLFIIDINSSLNTSDEIEILDKIIENINKNKDLGIDTKFLIVINKCDNMFYKEGKLSFDEDSTELYNQILITLEQKFKKNNLNLDIENTIVPISSEDSFVYKIFGINPDIELEQKYIDKFGFNEFGKTRWSTMIGEEKKQKIKNILQSTDLSKALDITGYNNLIKKINTVMDTDIQIFSYLLKLISFITEITINIENPQEMIINRQEDFSHFKFVEISLEIYKDSKYMSVCNNLYDTAIKNYYEQEYIKVKKHIYINNDTLYPYSNFCKNNNEYTIRLDEYLCFLHQIRQCFIKNDLKEIVNGDIKKLKDSLRNLYISLINNSTNFEDYFKNFDKHLKYYNDHIDYLKITNELIHSLFSRSHFNKENLNKQILQEFYRRKYFDKKKLIEHIFDYIYYRSQTISYLEIANLEEYKNFNGIDLAYRFYIIDFLQDLKQLINFKKYYHLIKYSLFNYSRKTLPLHQNLSFPRDIFLKFQENENILPLEKYLLTLA